MAYYDLIDEDGTKGTGIDWNLAGCLNYNPQAFSLEEVVKVAAVIEGDHEGPDWHWVLELTNGRYAYLTGGCDYTGWDCQSSAWSKITANAVDACTAACDLTDDEYGYDSPEKRAETAQALWTQIIDGKAETKREAVGKTL